ncbi:hypothetical protein [Campylobacter gastrosuis]|uniref:Uncharacterized protein n=1 Tax=Campylobacter gastrosuis TaxID=2974576 RepID=A0ABT7HSX2_9BACT|nr:hypothetical protein [Campylobacter gastrosuis]MDL0089852.1 hypothetical protein [Campylobacter gastrosuis]
MDITQKLSNYTLVYRKILAESMAENTPFDKIIKKTDEYFEKYGISDDKRFDVTTSMLSTILQTITATSQEIALRFLIENEKLESELKLADAELAIKKAEIPLKQAEQRRLEAEIPLKVKELELAAKRLILAEKEAEFNTQRAKLIQAQALSEEARKRAIEREIKSYDDKLRMQKSSDMKDLVFGYASGGVAVPANMQTKAIDLINQI